MPVRAFIRSWRLQACFVFGVLTAAGLVVVPSNELSVPGRGGVLSVIWPLLPTLLAIPIPMVVDQRTIELHLTCPHLARRRAYAAVAAVGVAAMAIAPGAHLGGVILARNSAALLGLGLLGGALLPRGLSWSLLALVPMSMWLLGTRRDQSAHEWAVLLRPVDDARATWVCVSVLIVGAVLVTIGRPRHGP